MLKYNDLALFACLSLVATSLMAEIKPPSLSDLFSDITYRQAKLSPNGRSLALMTPIDGRDSVVVLDLNAHKISANFRVSSPAQVGDYQWVKDDYLIMSMVDHLKWTEAPRTVGVLFGGKADNSEFQVVYGQQAGAKQIGTRSDSVYAASLFGELMSPLYNDESNVQVTSWPFTASGQFATPTAFKLDLKTLRKTKLAYAPMAESRFIASPSGEVRYAMPMNANGYGHVYEYHADKNEWTHVALNTSDNNEFLPLGLTSDGKTAYYLSDQESKTTGLYSLNLTTRASQLLYRQDSDTIESVHFDPYSGEALWIVLESDHRVVFINDAHPVSKVRIMLGKSFAGQNITIDSMTRDGKTLLVHTSSDRDPGAWYLVDTDSKKATFQVAATDKIDPDQMLPTKSIEFKARDGLLLHGFYTRPRGDASKPPMILLVHSGPHSKDTDAFNPEVQMLSTRGYAVLQVNYRGSTGSGRALELDGRGDWGGKMQNDLTDATHWAVEQGLADAQRVCLMGSGYGGYAVLMGLAREPNLFQCGVDMYGISDLELFLSDSKASDASLGKSYLQATIAKDRKEWEGRSPVKLADKIKAPILIIHGRQDEVIDIAHSVEMEKALKSEGKNVETMYFDSEGHGFSKLEHRVQAYQKILDFLSEHLGV